MSELTMVPLPDFPEPSLANQQLTNSFQNSLHQHQEWVQTRELVSRLTQAAVQSNVAGNDVFDTLPVLEARSVSDDANAQFAADVILLRDPIDQMSSDLRRRVARQLESAESEMETHQKHAELVFSMMETGDRDAAGTAMARMDRTFGVLLNQLSGIRRMIADQHVNLANLQMDQLESMRRAERIVFIMVALMIVFVVVYGVQLSRRAGEQFSVMNAQRDAVAVTAMEMSSLARLAAGVAHELRNPLTAISLLVQSGLRKDSAASFDLQDLRVVSGELQRMERTLNVFIDFARPPRPRIKLIDFGTCLENVVRLISEQARANHVTIDFTRHDAVLSQLPQLEMETQCFPVRLSESCHYIWRWIIFEGSFKLSFSRRICW